MEILKRIFIPLPATTYGKNASYIFVDFLMNCAGRSNYGGPFFGLGRKTEIRIPKSKIQDVSGTYLEAVANPLMS
jgi:hypothetical protein